MHTYPIITNYECDFTKMELQFDPEDLKSKSLIKFDILFNYNQNIKDSFNFETTYLKATDVKNLFGKLQIQTIGNYDFNNFINCIKIEALRKLQTIYSNNKDSVALTKYYDNYEEHNKLMFDYRNYKIKANYSKLIIHQTKKKGGSVITYDYISPDDVVQNIKSEYGNINYLNKDSDIYLECKYILNAQMYLNKETGQIYFVFFAREIETKYNKTILKTNSVITDRIILTDDSVGRKMQLKTLEI